MTSMSLKEKIAGILIAFSLLILGAWCLIFKAYYATGDEIHARLSLGDKPGALDSLKTYQASILAYPIYNYYKFEKFRFRSFYLEGVVSDEAGNHAVASTAFRKATQSQEAHIAAASKYNLSHYAIKDGSFEKARMLLNEALMLDPEDMNAKINLELVLKKNQAGHKADLPKEKEEKESVLPQAEPGEQWRLDVPDEDGEGSGASSGRSFL